MCCFFLGRERCPIGKLVTLLSRFSSKTCGAFQTGYITLQRALWSEKNHGRHIEGSFQTNVFKTGHFKGPFGMKDFEGYNWWTLRPPWFFAGWWAISYAPYGHGMMTQKGTSRNSCATGSLEIRASTYISAKLKKHTYMYDSLQFPVEMNARGSKLQQLLFLFTRSMIYRYSFD